MVVCVILLPPNPKLDEVVGDVFSVEAAPFFEGQGAGEGAGCFFIRVRLKCRDEAVHGVKEGLTV